MREVDLVYHIIHPLRLCKLLYKILSSYSRGALVLVALITISLVGSASTATQNYPDCTRQGDKERESDSPFKLKVCFAPVVSYEHGGGFEIITFPGTPQLSYLEVIDTEKNHAFMIPLDEYIIPLDANKKQKIHQHFAVRFSEAFPNSYNRAFKLAVLAVPDADVVPKLEQKESIVEGIVVMVKK